MANSPTDIFTEPEPDPDTLSNLGPLRPMAGVWETKATGIDVHPVVDGTEQDAYSEHYELQPIDAQTNGPQLFYGMRYHTHIKKPGELLTFHDQIGYWPYEPATETVILSLAIPRAQVALASGHAGPNDTTFELSAKAGDPTYGFCSTPFLEYTFRTVSFTMVVSTNADGTWSYQQDTILLVKGRSDAFHHSDHNVLHKIAEPTPNPAMLA